MDPKRSRKHRRIKTGRLAMVGIILALLLFCGFSIKNILVLHSEQAQLKEENETLKLEKKNLENELENANDLEYIEEQARKQLRMIKPGEVLYVTGNKDEETSGEETGNGAQGGSEENSSGQTGGQ